MAQFTSDSPLSAEVTVEVCRGLKIKMPVVQWQKLREAQWFNPTRQAMDSLPWDTDDWTIGGKRTQSAAVYGLFTLLVKVLDSRTPPPSVVPTWKGGVQVEWHRNNVDFEIEADPQGEVEYFFSSFKEEDEGQAWDNINQLTEYARLVA